MPVNIDEARDELWTLQTTMLHARNFERGVAESRRIWDEHAELGLFDSMAVHYWAKTIIDGETRPISEDVMTARTNAVQSSRVFKLAYLPMVSSGKPIRQSSVVDRALDELESTRAEIVRLRALCHAACDGWADQQAVPDDSIANLRAGIDTPHPSKDAT